MSATDIEPEDALERDEGLMQKTPLLNATSFAATAFARSSTMSGMSFYIPAAMEIALGEQDSTADPRDKATVYVPAACTWIFIAGPKIYEYCKNRTSLFQEFNLDRWVSWKSGFGKIARDSQLDNELRSAGLAAQEAMQKIEVVS